MLTGSHGATSSGLAIVLVPLGCCLGSRLRLLCFLLPVGVFLLNLKNTSSVALTRKEWSSD